MKGIHNFTNFNDFHHMANGGLSASHEDLHVFNFNEISKDSNKSTPLFKTNFYQIGLFSSVLFEVSYFGKPQTINQKNVIVMFKPGQTVSFSKSDPNAEGYAIMFKEHFIDWRLSNSNMLRDFSILNPSFNSVLFLEDEPFNDLLEIAQKMHYEYRLTLNVSTLNILRLYSQLLIEKINRLYSQPVKSNFTSLQYKNAQDFKTLVYQNIQKTKSVSDYAKMLLLTEKTLINHFKQSTEMTPKDFINNLIIEESKALLSNNATVDQVSDYFNFTDQAHFSNFFKKKTGKTPNHFKKS
ncbi:MAG: helix-turn-helix domain-containing protein [Leadbetterella sp.]|nr:helix-turn-helix domain-containing protein [Leadbetterella sp.]